MKKLILLIITALLLAGCRSTLQTTESYSENIDSTSSVYNESTSLDHQLSINVYTSIGAISDSIAELNPDKLLQRLQEHEVLPEDCSILFFSDDDGMLILDMNDEFKEFISSLSEEDEQIYIYCLVNTFIDTYNAKSILLTVNDNELTTSYNIYDYPLTYARDYLE